MARTRKGKPGARRNKPEPAAIVERAEADATAAPFARSADPPRPGSAERRRRELQERRSAGVGEGTEAAAAVRAPPARSAGSPRPGSAERRRRELQERRSAAIGEGTGTDAAVDAPAARAAGSPRPGSAERRRRELQERKTAVTRRSVEPARKPSGDLVAGWLDSSQENEVRAFIATQTAQMDQRKYQMSLIKDFLGDPSRFGISPGDIPTSTSLPEFAERRRELQYRISIIRTFLDLLNDELRLLDQAEAYARKNGSGTES